jgi:arabinofuranosyltransferase
MNTNVRVGGLRVDWIVAILGLFAFLLPLRHGLCTQDDAFISFRYAGHLLEGHGLVYNIGERVEGYTNLSWTLLIAGWMALGVAPELAAALMGAVAQGFCTGLAGWVGARLGGPWGAAAGVLLLFDLHGALEAVEGLETSTYAAMVGLGTWWYLKEGERHWLGSTLLFGVAALTRPEAPLLAAALHAGGLLGADNAELRWIRLRKAILAGGFLAVVLGALTSWRWLYYGEMLPNTYYAKVGGTAWLRGFQYLLGHFFRHPGIYVLGVWGMVVARREARGLHLGAAALVLAQVVWIVRVGGDFKPTGRFLMPILPILAGYGGVGIGYLMQVGWKRAALLGVVAVSLGSVAWHWAEVEASALDRRANLEARRTLGLFLKAHLPPETVIAIHSAGVVPYFAGLTTIDMWGLTDHHIARAPVGDFGDGIAGHEKSDPAYVFSRDPQIYLPEDRVFTLKAWPLEVEPNFPADFTDRYQSISVPIEGRFANIWVKRGFLASIKGSSGE